jgi:hypothetical protein
MKWPRYRRVISLEIQVGITSQINKWANTDPRKYWRWDKVPRRNKHPLPTGQNIKTTKTGRKVYFILTSNSVYFLLTFRLDFRMFGHEVYKPVDGHSSGVHSSYTESTKYSLETIVIQFKKQKHQIT